MELWEKAYALGFKDKVSLFSLYRGGKKLLPGESKYFSRLEEALRGSTRTTLIFSTPISPKSKLAAVRGGRRGRSWRPNRPVHELFHDLPHPAQRISAGRGLWQAGSVRRAPQHALFLDRRVRSPLGPDEARHRLPEAPRRAIPGGARRFRGVGARPRRPGEKLSRERAGQGPPSFLHGVLPIEARERPGGRRGLDRALGIGRHVRFEASYNFAQMQARYFQAFCLRGLGRPQGGGRLCPVDQRVRLELLPPHRQRRVGIQKTPARPRLCWGRKQISTISISFDRELGITTFAVDGDLGRGLRPPRMKNGPVMTRPCPSSRLTR